MIGPTQLGCTPPEGWVLDVRDGVEVRDALRIDPAVSAGAAGGGTGTPACGAVRPDRLRAVASVAGPAPDSGSRDTLDWRAGRGGVSAGVSGEVVGAALRGGSVVRDVQVADGETFATLEPAQVRSELDSPLPGVERRCVTAAGGQLRAASGREALSRGIDAMVEGDLAVTRPCGGGRDETEVPVQVWQGTAGLLVAVAHGRWAAAAVPAAGTHPLEGLGHLANGIGHEAENVDLPLAGA